MFQNQHLSNHINHIHERAQGIAYQDHNLTFHDLLAKEGSFKIHDSNLQKILIDTIKVKMKLALELMNEAFDITKCPYPLRNELGFKV